MIKHVFRWENENYLKARMEPWICYQGNGAAELQWEQEQKDAAKTKVKPKTKPIVKPKTKPKTKPKVNPKGDWGFSEGRTQVLDLGEGYTEKVGADYTPGSNVVAETEALGVAKEGEANRRAQAEGWDSAVHKEIAARKGKSTAGEGAQSKQYTGPQYQDWRTFDPTPKGINLKGVGDEEFVENRITNMIDTGSPLYRQATEAALAGLAQRGLGRNASMAQEQVMQAIMKVAVPIAQADAKMLAANRTLRNTSYYNQMQQRLDAAIKSELSHISGGYGIQQAQISGDYQIEGAQIASESATERAKYVSDLQYAMGMQGVKLNAAELLQGIEDNAQATAYTWDMIFGDNVSPADWLTKWKETWV